MKAKLGTDAEETLTTMGNLASTYQAAGRLSDAITLMEETLKRMRAKLGADHPYSLATMNSLAWAYQEAGRIDDAMPLFEESVRLEKTKLGADHPETLIAMNNLGWAYRAAGRLSEAIPLFEETLKKRRLQAWDGSPQYATVDGRSRGRLSGYRPARRGHRASGRDAQGPPRQAGASITWRPSPR